MSRPLETLQVYTHRLVVHTQSSYPAEFSLKCVKSSVGSPTQTQCSESLAAQRKQV